MRRLRIVCGAAAVLALVTCIASAFLLLAGTVSESGFKQVFLVASIAWFVFAWLWAREKTTASAEKAQVPAATEDRPSSAPY